MRFSRLPSSLLLSPLAVAYFLLFEGGLGTKIPMLWFSILLPDLRKKATVSVRLQIPCLPNNSSSI